MQKFIVAKHEEIAELCRKHHVRRLSVFGSATRDDFDPAHSDVDVLVDFDLSDPIEIATHLIDLESSLAALLERRVEIIREGLIQNPYRLQAIESGKVMLYAAA